MGSRLRAFDWYQNRRSWMTLNGEMTVMLHYFFYNFYRAKQLCWSGLRDRNSICPSIRLSVRLSVRHTRALWRKEKFYCRYFYITWKGNHSSFLVPKEVSGQYSLLLKFALEVTCPLLKRQLWPISIYNVWTIRASKKCPIIANRKSIRAFQRAIDVVRMLP